MINYRKLRQIIELLMEIVWIVINRKHGKTNESDDNIRPHSDI